MSDGSREADTARGQGVERGRGRARMAVAADVIGAKRIDGHEEDVRMTAAGGRGRLPPAIGEREGDRQQHEEGVPGPQAPAQRKSLTAAKEKV